MDWSEIDFVLEEESPSRRSRPFLDGWETIRFVMDDEAQESPGSIVDAEPGAESGSM